MKDVWENYFVASSKVNISEKCKEELAANISVGAPFKETIFDEAAREVFDILNSGHLSTRFGHFANAAIYKYCLFSCHQIVNRSQ